MIRKSFFALLLTGVFLFPACTDDKGTDRGPVFQQIPEFREIKPERPVKIKLKRGTSGSFSWEISGNDAGRIIEEDRKLKESVGKDE